MKWLLPLIMVSILTGWSEGVFSQGWHAVIEVDFNNGNVAVTRIRNAYISFSGATLSGSFPTGSIKVSLTGEGTPSGPLYIKASGTSADNNVIIDVSTTYTGDILPDCQPKFLEAYDHDTDDQYITGTITVYPRLAISGFSQDCDEIRVATNTCSPHYLWEISESIAGPYDTITAAHSSTMTLTRDEIRNLGLATAYGRKYIRVTGLPGTTSQLQPVDIYYPGPTATFSVTSPKCHDDADGMINIDIVSSYPQGIQDFILTTFKNNLPVGNMIIDNATTVNIPNLSAGSYRFEIQNHSSIETYGSCLTDFTVDPLINPPEVVISSFRVSDYNGYPIKCKGGADGTLEVTASGGTGVFSAYEWIPNVSSSATAIDLSEQEYMVKVKDSNDCWSQTYRQILTAPEPLAIGLQSTGGKNGFDVSCPAANDGVITATVSGGVPDYSYLWSDGSSLGNLAAAGAGLHTVAVTDGNGCTAVESLTLTAPPLIELSIIETSAIICPGDQSGALRVQSNLIVTGPVNYWWSSGESDQEISGKAAGVYSVTVSDANECQVTESRTLTEPRPYTLEVTPASDYNGSMIECHGGNNGKLATIVWDENHIRTAAEYYSWYKNENEFAEGPALDTLDQLTSGIYRVEIIYNGQCRIDQSFVLAEPDSVLPSISTLADYHGFPITCYGASDGRISARATGGTGSDYTFTWETGETEAILTNVDAGNYIVTARDINGCEGKATKVLAGPERIEASISIVSDHAGQPISCNGAADGRISASASGGTGNFIYSWNTGDIGPQLSHLPAADYSVVVTDLNGCTGHSEISLADPVAVKAVISEISDYNGYGVTCSGSSDGFVIIKGTGGSGIYHYWWDGVQTYDSLHGNLPAGTYEVMITDENGCSGTTRATITEPDPLSLTVSDVSNISCYDGSNGAIQLQAAGGAGVYEYSIDGITWQTRPGFAGLKAITYRLEARDINGCRQATSSSLTNPAKLTVSFEHVEPAYCRDPRGKATAFATGGTGNYRYEWTDEQSTPFSHEQAISNLAPGVYTLRVFDDNNCETYNTLGITSSDGPAVKINNIVSATCSYSSDGRALLEISEGNGPFLFRWPDGQTTPEGINLPKGNYLVSVTDTYGCRVIESVIIPAPEVIDVRLVESVEPICNGECTGKLKVTASGGNGNYLYQWSDYSGPEYRDLCAGKYNLKVTDEKGCHSETNYNLSQPPAITGKLKGAVSPVCHDRCDGKLSILATGGTGMLAYSWSTGVTGAELSGLCAGTYNAVITDARQCAITETYTLHPPSGSPPDLGGSATLCVGQAHMLDAGPGYVSYRWRGNNGFTSSKQQITLIDPGLYWLEARNEKGCTMRDTFLLETTRHLLKANFLLTSEAEAGDTVVIIDVSWPLPDYAAWNFPPAMKRLKDLGDIVYGRFDQAGAYDVSLTSTLGECTDEIIKKIVIIESRPGSDEGRLGYDPPLIEFNVYPNPNKGRFYVSIELSEEGPVILSVWNIQTARKVHVVHDSGRKTYFKEIDVAPLSSGTYTLRLDYREGTRYIRFIVR